MKTISAVAILGLVSVAWLAQYNAPLAAQEQGGDSKAVLAKFKVAKNGDVLLVPVRVRGKDYQFMLSTGASFSVLDTSLLQGDAIEIATVVTPNGLPDIKFHRPPEIKVGPFSFRAQKIGAADFAKLRQVSGEAIFGALGMDFLMDYVVIIDFDLGEVVVRQTAETSAGHKFTLRFPMDRRPYVFVQVLGGKYAFLIATDSVALDAGQIDRPLFGINLIQKNLTIVNFSKGTDLSGDSDDRLGQTDGLQLGELRIPYACFGEGNGNFLGLGFLSRFKVVFDFPRKTMYLTKGKQFDRPDLWDRSGLHLLRDNSKTVVHSIDRDSIAARAGLRADDEIASLLGQKAADISMFEIRRHFATPGTAIPLVIRRSGQDYQATLKLGE